MTVSPPSSEKRFWPTYRVWRNFRKARPRADGERDALFLGVGEAVLAERARLEAVAQPAADREILDVHVLDAGGAAVGLLHELEDLAQLHGGGAAAEDEIELAVEIGLGELHVLEREFRGGAVAEIERVELGDAVAEAAIGADEGVDLRLFLPGLPDGSLPGGGLPGRGGGLGWRSFTARRRRLLATEFESGEEGVPLDVDAGGIGFPLLIKSFELRTVVGGGRIGAGDAVVVVGVRLSPLGMTVIGLVTIMSKRLVAITGRSRGPK